MVDGCFRVIIAGSRDFADYNLLREKCNFFLANKLPDVTIISGGAKGADRLGEQYARENGLNLKVIPADWKRLRRRAGYIRNQKMADTADALIAFWDGESRGTAHMIQTATDKGLLVRVIRY